MECSTLRPNPYSSKFFGAGGTYDFLRCSEQIRTAGDAARAAALLELAQKFLYSSALRYARARGDNASRICLTRSGAIARTSSDAINKKPSPGGRRARESACLGPRAFIFQKRAGIREIFLSRVVQTPREKYRRAFYWRRLAGTINFPPPRLLRIPSPLHDERIVSWVKLFTHALLGGDGRVKFQTQRHNKRPSLRICPGNG